MMSHHSQTRAIACVITLSACCRLYAGDIAPPDSAFSNGLPIATMKSMNEIEPRTPVHSLPFPINRSGSYYLSGSLKATDSSDGIAINADDVKLDLNGFSLSGDNTGGHGIIINGTHHNITIRNGVIRDWNGLGLTAANAYESRIQGLSAFDNDGGGFRIGGHCLVIECGAFKNTDTGIYVGNHCTIRDCKALDNQGASGIQAGMSSRITGCDAARNGKHGILAGSFSTIRDCTVLSNAVDGISVGSRSRVEGNNAFGNTTGINITGGGCRVEGNNAAGNSVGMQSAGSNLIIRNSSGAGQTLPFGGGENDQAGTLLQGGSTALGSSEPWANFVIPIP